MLRTTVVERRHRGKATSSDPLRELLLRVGQPPLRKSDLAHAPLQMLLVRSRLDHQLQVVLGVLQLGLTPNLRHEGHVSHGKLPHRTFGTTRCKTDDKRKPLRGSGGNSCHGT